MNGILLKWHAGCVRACMAVSLAGQQHMVVTQLVWRGHGCSRSQHELTAGGECNHRCCWQPCSLGDMCSGLTSDTQCSARCTCQSAGDAYRPRAEGTLQLTDAAAACHRAASHPHGSQSLLLGCCCSTSTTRSSCSCWLQLAWQQLPQGQPRPGGTLLLRALLGNGGRRHACASPPPTQTGVQRRLELLLGHQVQWHA